MTRLARPFAAVGWTVAVAAVLGTILVRFVAPAPFVPAAFGFGPAVMVAFLIVAVSWTSVGALLVLRRPENSIGWLMMVAGAGYALCMLSGALLLAFVADSSVESQRRAQYAGWAIVLFSQAGVLGFMIGYVFPTGHAQSPRWATFVRVLWVLMLGFTLMVLSQPGPLHLVPAIENPFGFGPDLRAGQALSPILTVLAAIVLPTVVISLVTRYRSSGPIERQQIKWLALGLIVSTAGLAFTTFGALLPGRAQDGIGLTIYALSLALVPLAIAVAILRYRLYEIDRLLSRTVSWAVVTGVLFGLFAVVNLGLQEVAARAFLGTGVAELEGVIVALSTLVVAALFQPIRTRVQRFVDRRFHRSRYDADRMTQDFAARLRDEMDLGALVSDLAATTRLAVDPSSAATWLRARDRR